MLSLMKDRAAIALITATLLLSATTAAYADHAYTAHARAVGLTLKVQDHVLTAALTGAKVQSGPVEEGCKGNAKACATAAGLVEPLGETARASAPGNQGTKTAPASTLTPARNTLLGQAITGRIGQSTAAATAPADTRAKGTAGQNVVSLDVGEQVPAVRQRMHRELPSVMDSLAVSGENRGISRVADGLTHTQDQAAGPFVKVTTGPALSESTDINGTTTATAIANGAEVVIGPAAPLSRGAALGATTPERLIVLRISRSMATATTNQRTGKAGFSPPTVTVRSLADTGLGKVSVAPGQSSCFATSTVFETCVTVASGAKRAEGAAAAAAVGGVEVSTLRTQGKGAVNLRLGAVEVGVNAASRHGGANSPEEGSTPGRAAEPSARPARLARVLPKTGAMSLTLPGLILVGASGLTLAALRRRRT